MNNRTELDAQNNSGKKTPSNDPLLTNTPENSSVLQGDTATSVDNTATSVNNTATPMDNVAAKNDLVAIPTQTEVDEQNNSGQTTSSIDPPLTDTPEEPQWTILQL